MKIALIIVALLWFILSTIWYDSSSCNSCSVGKPETEMEERKLPTLSLSDGDWNKKYDEHFSFKLNSEMPNANSKLAGAIDELSMRCKQTDISRSVYLKGFYSETEKYSGKYENLGIARAEEVKKMMVSKGVSAQTIFTTGEALSEDSPFYTDKTTLYGGIDVNIQQIKAGQVTELAEDILLEPRILYFETGKNALVVSDELSNYLENAKTYLSKNPDVKLAITGFTDNQGNADSNLKLSKERASFVLGEFVKKGLNGKQLISDGKGLENPIATNDTEEGRKQNRRVEVQIIKK